MNVNVVTVLVAVLFAGFGSLTADETVAVFVTIPGVVDVFTTSAMVAAPPFARVPRLLVTGPVPEQEPWLGVLETNVDPAGSVSTTVTPVAVDGPLLVTVML